MNLQNFFIAMAAGLIGCSPPPLDTVKASNNLKTQAQQVRPAILQEDHQGLADVTHPKLIEAMGGKAKFIQRLETIAAEMRQDGYRMVDIAFDEPSELVESSGDVFAFIPFQLKMSGPENATGLVPSFLISVSTDRGATWKFIDGNGVADNQEMLKRVLPNFPDKLKLPPKRKPMWLRQ